MMIPNQQSNTSAGKQAKKEVVEGHSCGVRIILVIEQTSNDEHEKIKFRLEYTERFVSTQFLKHPLLTGCEES